MVSNKRTKTKRILIIIISSILIFTLLSFAVTKIVYDGIFRRYDCEIDLPIKLSKLVSERTEHHFYSGKNLLAGYHYKSNNEQNTNTLVIIAPGFNACADNYLWQIDSLLQYGWSVFVFNTTGCCTSQGDSSIGFTQEYNDLTATLKYIETKDRFGCKNLVLLGHSRGGYAVCCALNTEYKIDAVVSVSGINSTMEGVIGSSVNKVGAFAYANYPFLWGYQSALFSAKKVSMKADEIIKNSHVPVLLIHGQSDQNVPVDKFSIVSYFKDSQAENVELMLRRSPDNDGHTNILYDDDGTANDEIMLKINDFYKKSIAD